MIFKGRKMNKEKYFQSEEHKQKYEQAMSELKGKKYYFQEVFEFGEERGSLPCCKGCFNEYGSCGTPCVECSIRKEWDEQWTPALVLWNKYWIWERKEVKK